MMRVKKIIFLFLILLLLGVAGTFIISGGDFLLILSGVSYGYSAIAPSGGNFSVVSSVGQHVGTIPLSGGDYSIVGGLPGGLVLPAYLKDDLSEVIVFPNPFKPGSGGKYDATEITFRNLTRRATIRIYNIAGELVRTIEVDSVTGEAKWKADNDLGEKLASGVYIYYISAPGGLKAKGMISIVR